SALSIAITGLAAFIGITITPKALISNDIYTTEAQTYSGILLALILVIWAEVSQRKNLKSHFRFVYATFALHLIGICCIKGMFESFWPVFIPILAGSCYYFYKLSYRLKAVSIFMFTLAYGYMGANLLVGRLLVAVLVHVWYLFAYLSPFYLIGSIVLFVMMIKRFNKFTNDGD